MQLLVVDKDVESQTVLARRVNDLGTDELEKLEIVVKLSDPSALESRLVDTDVVLFGSGVSAETFALSRKIKNFNSRIQIIAIISDAEYSTGAFRLSQDSGIRMVLPQRATPLDLLQGLVAIDTERRLASNLGSGQLTVFANGKGGLGITTVIAALGEFFTLRRRRALLWDLDIETWDLTRALFNSGTRSAMLTHFVKSTSEITKQALKEACICWRGQTFVLPPPDMLAAGLDIVSHPDSLALVDQLLNTARESFDHIMVDLGGRLGPGAAKLMQQADNLVILVDDSWLGLTATATYLSAIEPIMHGNFSTVSFVGAGTKFTTREIRAVLEKKTGIQTPDSAWQCGVIPFDAAARKWPGSGAALYSIGSRATKLAVEKIGDKLDAAIVRAQAAQPAQSGRAMFTLDTVRVEQLGVSHPFAPKPAKIEIDELEVQALMEMEYADDQMHVGEN